MLHYKIGNGRALSYGEALMRDERTKKEINMPI
jgi:hypothetical protein